MNKLFSRAGLLVLALLVVLITALTNYFFKGARLDLTEDHVYTLSEGTHNLLKGLPGPVTLKLFYSDKQTANMPQFRNYSNRVQELLQEYVQASSGKLTLETIDPEPFSEDEDKASEYGLQAVPLSQGGGNEIYFGLVIVSDDNPDKREVISFLHPDKERFLEYDLSKLVFAVSQKEKPKVGLVAGLQVNGGFDMMSRQQSGPWISVSQMEQLYDVQQLGTDFEDIDDDIKLLLLIFPQKLTGKARYAIDQYVMRGGHVLVFADPFAEQAGQGGGFMMGMGGGDKFASLPDLFKAWGIEMDTTKVVGDAKHALMVSSRSGRPVRHLGLLGYGVDNMATDDVIMAGLDNLNFGSAGHITAIEGATTTLQPLVTSSDQSMLIDASKFTFLSDPKALFEGFKPSGEKYVLAARITGPVKTAYPDGVPPEDEKPEAAPGEEDDEDLDMMDEDEDEIVDTEEEEEEEESTSAGDAASNDDSTDDEAASEDKEPAKPKRPHVTESQQPANIIVVADTDVLTDRLWVQVNSFFGQQIVTPFANNGDMLVNMVDNLLGNADLISIRSRGKFSRPFTKVNELEQQAEARFREKADSLNDRLKETESKLRELQAKKEGEEKLVLSPEQEQAVEQFQQEKLKIRKELREVQHQLGKNIEQLGTALKLINILAIPLLLTVLVLFVRQRRRKRVTL
ncbi:GldG family protein [Spongorhabdus nitratireducens]